MNGRREIKKEPIEIFGGSLMRLHKVLKVEDILKAQDRAERRGEEVNIHPVTVIDFNYVTSIQEDFKRHGTVIIDNTKSTIIVTEPLEDVLDAWVEIKGTQADAV